MLDWWQVYHKAMLDIPWASPEVLNRTPLVQLVCLTSETPPQARRAATFEEYQEAVARRKVEETKWSR